ncbi:methyltransferase domain-containing protein [Acidiphilium sp. AL]|uniref:Methyltransferase domain-containing protein n=1 Tax=Acidiphilium iwatense TaxID=768198 RepID=A0ABS9E0C3_9PROT|nr:MULTISPECIES: transcription antitermination factor NusB [Acidiphilium]MCF3947470.1 methyltransferase domain-containing protein [Acidiphilium iwatense]MCU4160707.1 methyltransferase domain-containing protein [Acidiphilium sp. AL]
MKPQTSDPTREAAFALLSAVFDRHAPLDTALDSLRAIPARDRAAAHRIAAAVLRRTGSLDAVLDAYLTKAPPIPVRHALRIGTAQLLLLGAPAHAAVSTAVGLAHARGLGKFAGLVNAVLRRVATEGKAALDALDAPRLDTPQWLWASWGADGRAIATAHQNEAPLDLSLKPGAKPPEGAVLLPTGSARLPAGTDVTTLAGFADGDFWVQDAAAALPARLLGDVAGQRVLDLCAAPGGKTAQLAAAGAIVTALDRDPARLERLRGNLARLDLTAETIAADALEWRPEPKFDAILLDAPCSATGTIRRHPEILHLRRKHDIAACAAIQDRLLDAAASMLTPGGRLVYAVCSLQNDEGAERIDAACARLGLRRDPLEPGEVPGLTEAITASGDLATHPGLWPDRGGMDGFFAARLIRS